VEKLDLPGLAIGGVLGAKHYFPDLDLVGTPRLDISLHARDHRVDLDFIEKLDPACAGSGIRSNPRASWFTRLSREFRSSSRDGGLQWADPVECLLDLHDARLETQAGQFLDALRQHHPLNP